MPEEMKHDFPFDPRYGYTREMLLKVGAPEAPLDFAAFWQRTYAEHAAVKLNFQAKQTQESGRFQIYEVEFDSLGGFRTGGWMVIPKDGHIECGFVVSHGYGGRSAPDLSLPAEHAAAIFPCARGFNRSARADIPGIADGHVIHGVDSRETYVHRGCVAEIWSAASALLEVAPQIGERLYFMGSSFGGGIGALALPWEKRFKKAFLEVPSFGNHPLRLTMQCVGSGESVRRYHTLHPEVVDVLKYFDSATAAALIRTPTLVAPALFDPAVPPPGQFAAYNAIPAEKELFVHAAGHFEHAGALGEARELILRLRQWFA
jgi:cephalosporin-C deacetylase